jgi:hypothetical protein
MLRGSLASLLVLLLALAQRLVSVQSSAKQVAPSQAHRRDQGDTPEDYYEDYYGDGGDGDGGDYYEDYYGDGGDGDGGDYYDNYYGDGGDGDGGDYYEDYSDGGDGDGGDYYEDYGDGVTSAPAVVTTGATSAPAAVTTGATSAPAAVTTGATSAPAAATTGATPPAPSLPSYATMAAPTSAPSVVDYDNAPTVSPGPTVADGPEYGPTPTTPTYNAPSWNQPRTPEPTAVYVAPQDDILEDDDKIKQEWAEKTNKEKAEAEWDDISHDKNVKIVSIVFGVTGFLLLLFVANQLIENPDGCFGKVCRCLLACISILCWPLRAFCCRSSRARERRSHQPMNGENGAYGYSHDLELT